MNTYGYRVVEDGVRARTYLYSIKAWNEAEAAVELARQLDCALFIRPGTRIESLGKEATNGST